MKKTVAKIGGCKGAVDSGKKIAPPKGSRNCRRYSAAAASGPSRIRIVVTIVFPFGRSSFFITQLEAEKKSLSRNGIKQSVVRRGQFILGHGGSFNGGKALVRSLAPGTGRQARVSVVSAPAVGIAHNAELPVEIVRIRRPRPIRPGSFGSAFDFTMIRLQSQMGLGKMVCRRRKTDRQDAPAWNPGNGWG